VTSRGRRQAVGADSRKPLPRTGDPKKTCADVLPLNLEPPTFDRSLVAVEICFSPLKAPNSGKAVKRLHC
jgi:hypothetical protein